MKKEEFIERHWATLKPMTLEEFDEDLDSVITQAIASHEAGLSSKLTNKLDKLHEQYHYDIGEPIGQELKLMLRDSISIKSKHSLHDIWNAVESLIADERQQAIADHEQWKPYPEFKPENKAYNVTLDTGEVSEDTFSENVGDDWYIFSSRVIAFRELPEGYKPKEGGKP